MMLRCYTIIAVLVCLIGCEIVDRGENSVTIGYSLVKRKNNATRLGKNIYKTFLDLESNLPEGTLRKFSLYKSYTKSKVVIRVQLWRFDGDSKYTLLDEYKDSLPHKEGIIQISPKKEMKVERGARIGFTMETNSAPIYYGFTQKSKYVYTELFNHTIGRPVFPRIGDKLKLESYFYGIFSFSAQVDYKALVGSTGERGQRGRDGRDGATGERGPKGRQGDRGDRGEKGKDGGQLEDQCKKNPSLCQHICTNTINGAVCSCRDGFEVRPSNHFQCQDQDECYKNNGGCQHKCKNTYGTYKCSCNPGFKLSVNKRTCDDINECTSGKVKCRVCLNTQGSYTCLSIGGNFAGQQAMMMTDDLEKDGVQEPARFHHARYESSTPSLWLKLQTAWLSCLTVVVMFIVVAVVVRYSRRTRQVGDGKSTV